MAIGVVVLLFAGCAVVMGLEGPCFFDPPPGDYSIVAVTNDTSQKVTLVECDGLRGYNDVSVESGEAINVQREACAVGTLAVAAPQSLSVQGCFDEPVGDPGPIRALAVSQARRRAGSAAVPGKIQIHEPGR